ncbi:hypothetical protein NBRC116583_15000 [Arenicella sp. 4NH20-0111]
MGFPTNWIAQNQALKTSAPLTLLPVILAVEEGALRAHHPLMTQGVEGDAVVDADPRDSLQHVALGAFRFAKRKAPYLTTPTNRYLGWYRNRK